MLGAKDRLGQINDQLMSQTRLQRIIDTYQHVKEIVGALKTLLPPGVELTLRMNEGLPAMFVDPEHINRRAGQSLAKLRERSWRM